MQARALDLTPYLALIAQELPRGAMVDTLAGHRAGFNTPRRLEYDPKARRPLADLCRHLLKAKGVQRVSMQCPGPDLQATVSIFPASGWPVYSFPAQDFLDCESIILREKRKLPTQPTNQHQERETNGNR